MGWAECGCVGINNPDPMFSYLYRQPYMAFGLFWGFKSIRQIWQIEWCAREKPHSQSSIMTILFAQLLWFFIVCELDTMRNLTVHYIDRRSRSRWNRPDIHNKETYQFTMIIIMWNV